jgi:hypothetical protein
VAQVIEHLPSQCEALSSNPGSIKRGKKMNAMTQKWISGSNGNLFLAFEEPPWWLHHFVCSFSTSSPAVLAISCLSHSDHPGGCEMATHGGLGLNFPND